MPNKKRKINLNACECFKPHSTINQCNEHVFHAKTNASAERHRAIAMQVILCSEATKVFVGKERLSYTVHEDLLTLHTPYFNKALANDMELEIPADPPTLFADFVSWMYSADWVWNESVKKDVDIEALWELGRVLQAPGFQNFCMHDLMNYCKNSETDELSPWPIPSSITRIYTTTPKASLLRKFAVDSIAYRDPLVILKKGDIHFEEWSQLLTQRKPEEAWIKDLRKDLARVLAEQWDDIAPWDDRRQATYMEVELSLDARWEKQILALRSKAEIKKGAVTDTDIRSVVEWGHLMRHKLTTEG